ncbi:MAG: ABC transporter permease [Planctomycetes bacterium]|nr:ABC transporter permease [Planctomycetota bacterium]
MSEGNALAAPPRGPWSRALQRFARHAPARCAAWVLLALGAVALLAEFFAPYGLEDARPGERHMPPNWGFVDARGAAHLVPFAAELELGYDEHHRRAWRAVPGGEVAVRFLVRGAPYRLLGILPCDVHLFGVADARSDAPRLLVLGATADGRDLFSCLLFGARVSLAVGLLGVAISFSIGLAVGGFSGFLGGRVDACVQRVLEALMLLPGFYVILGLDYALGDRARTAADGPPDALRTFLLVVVVIAAIQWASLARVVRGQVLSLRERDFVLAARALGLPSWRIVLRHVLPHTCSYAIVAASLALPGFILMESALSMLGLGIRAPQVSWGNLLASATELSALRQRPWSLAPGFAIALAVSAFHLVGDGLRDALDPEAESTR